MIGFSNALLAGQIECLRSARGEGERKPLSEFMRTSHFSIVGLLLLGFGTSLFAQGRVQQRSVPKDFSYPEGSETLQIAMTARSLAGVVRASNGEGLADVLVERVSADWKNRIDATFTDPDGRFVLSTLPDERYFLKVSKSGFCTLRVKVRVKKKAKSLLELALPLGI